jgi:hypothetical protein
MSPPVLAATAWPTNGHVVDALVDLGYLRSDWAVLDPTHGRGIWWKRWKPDRLVAHDLEPSKAPDGPASFLDLPYADDHFDAAVFDPPYVSVGGRKTSGLPDFLDRFGLFDAARTPAGLQAVISKGLAEVARVVRPQGFVIVKCQDYVSSGRLWPGTFHTTGAGLDLGLDLFDRLEHLRTSSGPQPDRTRKCAVCNGHGCPTIPGPPCEPCSGSGRLPSPQVHARRNHSTVLVFRKASR